MTVADPVVRACRRRHRKDTSVAHCSDCGICEGCDATLGVQPDPDNDRCETCANAADKRRLENLQAYPYRLLPKQRRSAS